MMSQLSTETGVASAEMMAKAMIEEEEGVAIEVEVAAVDKEAVIETLITRADNLGTTTIGDNNMMHLKTIIDSPVRSLTLTRTLSQSFEIEVSW